MAYPLSCFAVVVLRCVAILRRMQPGHLYRVSVPCVTCVGLTQEVRNQNNQPSGIAAVLVVPEVQGEGSVLITACDDKAMKMWTLPTFDRRGILAARAGHADVVRCLARGPGNSFFSGGMDNSILVWEFMS